MSAEGGLLESEEGEAIFRGPGHRESCMLGWVCWGVHLVLSFL